MEVENCPIKKKKLMNIAQKMLKFQAETSLFLMRKTKQREGGKRKDEKKDRKKKGSGEVKK